MMAVVIIVVVVVMLPGVAEALRMYKRIT